MRRKRGAARENKLLARRGEFFLRRDDEFSLASYFKGTALLVFPSSGPIQFSLFIFIVCHRESRRAAYRRGVSADDDDD